MRSDFSLFCERLAEACRVRNMTYEALCAMPKELLGCSRLRFDRDVRPLIGIQRRERGVFQWLEPCEADVMPRPALQYRHS